MVLPDGLPTPLLIHYLVPGLTLTSTPPAFVQSYQTTIKAHARISSRRDTIFRLVRGMYNLRYLGSLKRVAPLRLSPCSSAPSLGIAKPALPATQGAKIVGHGTGAYLDLNKRGPSRRVTKKPCCGQMNSARERSTLDDNIACDFAARPEGFLRFAIEFGFDAPSVAERQDKLVLAFPSGLFTRPEQGLLGTAAIDLNDDPTQLCRFKVQRQLFVRSSRPFE